jgi:4-amino-4-deoxy-L-arabinose transferase
MENIIWGITTVIICSFGYFYSWKKWRQENYQVAVLLLIACGLILRFYMATDFYLHEWDERYHALVAKNLINHPLRPTLYDNPVLPYDFQNWANNHIWVHKQPLPLWTMAASMSIFGTNEIALRLPSVLITTIGILLMFKIGSYFFNQIIGYISALLYSINGQIIELAGGRLATDHVDIFFLFFVELAIFFTILFIKKKKTFLTILVGISLGAAILSKWLPALIVLPVWLLMVIHSKEFNFKTIIVQFSILLFTSIVVFLPWQLYIHRVYPIEAHWEATFNLKHLAEALDGQTGPFYFFVDRIRINYGDLIYLPLGWFIWKMIKNRTDLNRLSIFCWFFIPFIFFSFVKTKLPAYLLFTSPALFMMTAEFWEELYKVRHNKKYRWIIILTLFLLIAFPVRFTIERMKPFQKRDRNPQWVIDLKELNNKHITRGILLNYPNPVEVMFYTDLIAYQYIPDESSIFDLIGKGYTIIVNENEVIPKNIKAIEGVRVVRLALPK